MRPSLIVLDGDSDAVVPSVDNEIIIPRVRIFDPAGDGSSWYRAVGFNRRISDMDSRRERFLYTVRP